MMWRRRKRASEKALAQAEQAVRDSVGQLHETVQRGREVRRITDRLRQIQQDNHFAEAIRNVYSGGQ